MLLGARHSWDLGYHAELGAMERQRPTFVYLPTISRPDEEPAPWTGTTGYVSDLWRSGVLERGWGFRPIPDTTRVLLCGNPDMIEGMIELLAREGFREHTHDRPGEVFAERFW